MPPPAFTVNVTVAVLKVDDEPVIVTVGVGDRPRGAGARLALAGLVDRPHLDARRSRRRRSRSASPRCRRSPRLDLPPASTTYLRDRPAVLRRRRPRHPDRARPCRRPWPRLQVARPGRAWRTAPRVLLTGDAFEPAPRSLIATTVNAYCLPYSSSPSVMASSVRVGLADRGASALGDRGHRVPLDLEPWPFAAGHFTSDRAVRLGLRRDAGRRVGHLGGRAAPGCWCAPGRRPSC